MATYALINDPVTGKPSASVSRSDGAMIPKDPNNADWQAYQAWLAAGNTLAPAAGPSIADLVSYATDAWQTVLETGQTFNVAASGAPAVNVLCDGTNATRADHALLALFGQANPSGSKAWLDNAGKVTTLSGTELVTLATLAGNWVADTYPALATIVGEIEASPPTITTKAQIDAFAWPTS